MNARIPVLLLLGLFVLPLAAGCAAGINSVDKGSPMDWFWTGFIAVTSLGVGFLIGATMTRSGSGQLSHRSHRHRRRTGIGWKRLGQRIQAGTRQGLDEWRSAGNAEQPDWGDLSRRIEERILDEMHKYND
jgi:hypothetical protein